MLPSMNPDTASKTHLFACATCRYTTEIGRSETVQCPHCRTAAGTHRLLDLDEILASLSAANAA